MSDQPNINFGDNVNINNFQTGENAKVVEGDEVAGDKVGNQVHGDNHGDMTQINAGNYEENCKEAVGNLMNELAAICEPLESDDVAPISAEFIAIEPEYHPLTLMADITDLSIQPEPPTEDQAFGLRKRLAAMFSRIGTAGKKTLVNLGPLAIAGMRATASITPPWNIVCPVIEAAVKQFGTDED